MNKILELFLKLAITKTDLQQALGNDLHNVKCDHPQMVQRNDVIVAIQKLLGKEVSVDAIVEWVNVLWFTNLFFFEDDDADSIVSVFSVLETMDEEDVKISNNALSNMIQALQHNTEYNPMLQ